MSTVTTNPRRAQPADRIVLVLAALGILTPLPFGWYAGTIFSVCALGVSLFAIWWSHQPLTRWTRVAAILIVIGFILQIAIAVMFTPLTPVPAG